ncbi:hypothetical protein AB3Y40_00875 [Yoonia sp. R2331]|uniref:hypothetical protein n=1 Tax=Yoonia sp. R2331 TaxID=3237238 RepID=UPI0034E57DD0
MTNESIPRLAAVLAWLCLAAMVVLPVGIALALILMPVTAELLATTSGLPVAPEVSTAQLWASVAVGLLPVAVLIWTFRQMQLLFAAFAKGAALTAGSAARIRRIGQGFLVLALVPLVVQPAQSVLLSWNAAPGARQVSIGLSSDMLGFAFVSGLLVLIGWAMGQAAHAAEENRAFV